MAISALLTGVVPVTTPTVSLVEDEEQGLPDAGAALLALGVPVDAVLALNREVARSVDAIAAAYARVNDEYIKGPWLAVGSPESTRGRVNEAATTLPGIAISAVSSTLLTSVREALDHSTLHILERPPG